MSRGLTIDELARSAGTTARQVRALQTHGLLTPPALVGRTGFYDREQLDRLRAVQRLQRQGFSLAGITVLFRALHDGLTVEDIVGLDRAAFRTEPGDGARLDQPGGGDISDQTGHAPGGERDDHFEGWPETPKGRLLSVVPTTWLEHPEAS